MDAKVHGEPTQSVVYFCPECPGVLICGKVNLDKHNEKCHKIHQDCDLEDKTSKSHQTCLGKKSQVEQNQNELVSRVVNDGLPLRSEQFNETLDANSGIRGGLKKVAVESGPSTGRALARRKDGLVNEQAGASESISFVMGKGRSTQAVLLTNFENGNNSGATSSSITDSSQVTVKMESTVEGVFPGTTANAKEVEVIYYDCKLCDVAFRRLQDLRAHLEIEHKIGPAHASAVVIELRKSEYDSDEDGPPLLSYIGGEDSDHGVGAVDVKHLLNYIVGKRTGKMVQKPNTADSNEFDRKRRSRSPSVEFLGTFQPAKAEGTSQGSPHGKVPLREFKTETGSPNVEAMDVEVNGVNDHGRSSAVRISNRMQPQSNGTVVDFNCKWCPKLFARNADLTDHIRCHHPNQKIVKCPMCKFKTAASLIEKHTSNRHGSTQDQWTMASTSKAILTPQPQAHPSRSRRVISSSHNNAAGGGEEIYGASSSPSTTRNRIATAGGQALKSGVRATNRPKEDKNAMNRKQDSNRVSKLAAGTEKRIRARRDKKHRCDECPEAFSRPCHLEDHKAKHTGEGPYTCPVPRCGRQDWSRYNMTAHMKSAHPSVKDPATRAAILQASDL